MKIISFSSTDKEQLVKPVFKDSASLKKCRILEPMKLHNEKAGDIFVRTVENEDGVDRFKVSVENSHGKLLAKDILGIDETSRIMTDFDIAAEPEYRKNNYRLGELLRLVSIMLMRENNCPSVKLASKDTAVYFHGKYKFAPDNTRFDDRDKMLETIAQDKNPGFYDLSQKAEDMLEEVKNSQSNAQKLRNLCIETNNLTKEYIERALQSDDPQKNHSFKTGINMILNRETVENNKDLFNNIYKNHGIDYTI